MNWNSFTRSAAGALLTLAIAACTGETEAPHLGYVEADWTYVSAPAAGRIIEQTVREGDRVVPGMFLFQLDSTAEEAALAQAEARVTQAAFEAENLDTGARQPELRLLRARLSEAEVRLQQARMDRDRILPLVEQDIAPKSQGDTVIANVEAAEAAVKAAQQDIEVAGLPARPASRSAAGAAAVSAEAARDAAAYRLTERRISAPEAGRVEEVFYRTGEYVVPGAPVFAILPDDRLKVRFFVPQDELSELSVGQTVQVRADGLSAPLQATISFIAGEAEFTPPVIYSRDSRGKLVFMVEAKLPVESGAHPGLPVEVDWQ